MSRPQNFVPPEETKPLQLTLLIYSNQDHPRDYDEPVRFEELPSCAQTSKQELEDLTDLYLMNIDLRKLEWKEKRLKHLAIIRATAVYEPGYEDYCAHIRKLFPESLDDFEDVCANI